MTEKPKAKRGFALWSPEKRKEVASKGGKACPDEKRPFSTDRKLASKAGRIGGRAGFGRND